MNCDLLLLLWPSGGMVKPMPYAAEGMNSEMLMTLTVILVIVTVLVKLSIINASTWPQPQSVCRE